MPPTHARPATTCFIQDGRWICMRPPFHCLSQFRLLCGRATLRRQIDMLAFIGGCGTEPLASTRLPRNHSHSAISRVHRSGCPGGLPIWLLQNDCRCLTTSRLIGWVRHCSEHETTLHSKVHAGVSISSLLPNNMTGGRSLPSRASFLALPNLAGRSSRTHHHLSPARLCRAAP